MPQYQISASDHSKFPDQAYDDGTQDVFQRIHGSTGKVRETLIGTFPVEPAAFGHPSLLWLAQYNLRELIGEDGVGNIVVGKDKTSHCVADFVPFNITLTGAPHSTVYGDCDVPILGISVGWADLYSTSIPEQHIDVTDVADGRYWLEVVVDPYDRVLKSDNDNNVTRILIDLDGDNNVSSADRWIWVKDIYGTFFGDADLNRAVNFNDFVALAEHYGQPGGWTNGEFRFSDFTQLSTAYGQRSDSVPVPEPSTLITFAVGLVLLAHRRTVSALFACR